jgi:hypothetical protein
MTTTLRPMSTGELLDRTFNLYRNNFLLFAGIATVAGIAPILASGLLLLLGITVPVPGAKFDPASVPGARFDPMAIVTYILVFLAVFFVLSVIASSLASAATIYAVSKVHLEQKVTINESYSKIFPLLGRILGVIGLIVLRMIGLGILVGVVVAAIVFGLVMTMRSGGGSGADFVAIALLSFVMFGLLVVGYFFIARLYFKYVLAVPACVVENTGASQALVRSGFLTKGSLWRIFLIYLLMGVIGAALSFALQLPANVMAIKAPQLALIWSFPATFLATTLAFPISTIAISLVYYDQRVRKEAFDLQLLMQSIAPSSQASASAATPIG